MEKFPNQENREGIESSIESEKVILGENAEEVSELVAEKDPGSLTDRAKLLLARAGKVAGVGLAAAGGVGLAATLGFGVEQIIEHTHAWGVTDERIKSQADLYWGAGGISAFATLLGAMSAEKLGSIVEKLKSKIGSQSTQSQ